MPSTYAHYRMGQEVRSQLDGREKEIVELYPELFLIGLHGPDILFFYKPLIPNRVNLIGHRMHKRPGKEFFERAAGKIKEQEDSTPFLAYIYGFICHFALDEACHGYVDEKMRKSRISHTEIEMEFDSMLMRRDGLDPLRHKPTKHIIPSAENAKVIHVFFPQASIAQVQKALRGTIAYNNLLVAPSKRKRMLIYAVMTVTGCYRKLRGLIANYQPNPRCEDSTEKLWLLYQEAEELALSLIREYSGYLKGKQELSSVYRYTFGSQLIGAKEDGNGV